MTQAILQNGLAPNPAPAENNACLQQKEDWLTPCRGTNNDEYQIYVDAALSLGWPVKSFHEWLNS